MVTVADPSACAQLELVVVVFSTIAAGSVMVTVTTSVQPLNADPWMAVY